MLRYFQMVEIYEILKSENIAMVLALPLENIVNCRSTLKQTQVVLRLSLTQVINCCNFSQIEASFLEHRIF